MNLGALGEERLLKHIASGLPRDRRVFAGAGDDCAVLQAPGDGQFLLLKTDCVVEGVHFSAHTDAAQVGWKAMARSLSDFAAMSGLPEFALITLIVPAGRRAAWVAGLYRGLARAARKFSVAIVGGETSGTAGPAVVSVSVSGRVETERWVSRSGGKPDDDLFVTGRLGGSLRRRHLRFTPRILESRWLTERFAIHAMIDLSDGLGADLPRLARASGAGFEVDERSLPRARGCTVADAISDGEDYELLFAVAPDSSPALERVWRQKWRIQLTRIGRLTTRGKAKQKLPSGYVHFR
ncbi:MAG: thiamine-phosphate kinase [Chthoniobacterales bacterium]